MKPAVSILAVLLAFGLAACGEEAEVAEAPPPQEPSREALGHYCGMIVVDHEGPKGQIFLEGRDEPLWFSSVRDTLAFTMLPEEPKTIAAIYVNDMGRAASWVRPEPGTWVEARAAFFVLGSDARGGMGAPEAVPFSDRAAAEAFSQGHGGEVFAFAEVPQQAILGENPAGGKAAEEGSHGKH